MLIYGQYKTNKESVSVSVTSAGVVYVSSPSSAGLTYVATPSAAPLMVSEFSTVNTASFTAGKIIAGSASAVSTNITAGRYLVSARGNPFYLRVGAAASLTTTTLQIAEGETRLLNFTATRISTINASAAGNLTLVKV